MGSAVMLDIAYAFGIVFLLMGGLVVSAYGLDACLKRLFRKSRAFRILEISYASAWAESGRATYYRIEGRVMGLWWRVESCGSLDSARRLKGRLEAGEVFDGERVVE